MDRFGAEAAALGWTGTELFGVHPQHGTLRVDYCGVMVISGRKADGVDARCVKKGNQSAYRDKPGKPVGVPIWEFAVKQGAR